MHGESDPRLPRGELCAEVDGHVGVDVFEERAQGGRAGAGDLLDEGAHLGRDARLERRLGASLEGALRLEVVAQARQRV